MPRRRLGRGKTTIVRLLRDKFSHAPGGINPTSRPSPAAYAGSSDTVARHHDDTKHDHATQHKQGAQHDIGAPNSGEASPQVHFFVYDAWVHSGDSLRREFLSTLVESLIEGTPWPDVVAKQQAKDRWDERKGELARTLRKTEKQTTLTFSLLGKCSAFVSVMWLVASKLFPSLESTLQSMGTPGTIPTFILSVLGSAALVQFASNLSGGTRGFSVAGWVDALASLVANKGVTKETVITLETPEPTSVQFQQAFDEFVGEAMAHDDRRLVIVIDNLDRVDGKQQQEIWALLSSFIDNPLLNGKTWFKKCWVIVPLARKRLTAPAAAALLPASAAPASTLAVATGPTIAIPVYSEAPDFFDKIFQISFRVPPPVLSNWKNLLHKLLSDAFEGEPDKLIHDVIRVYELGLPLDASPTPRSLKLFVNELVVLSLQWNGAFPITHLAAYVSQTRDLDVLQALRLNAIPSADIVRLLGLELRGDFAALYFNVSDTNKASYLLLRPVLSALLNSSDSETLKDRVLTDATAADVLDVIFVREVPTWVNEPSKLFRSCVALSALFGQPKSPLRSTDAGRRVSLDSLRGHFVTHCIELLKSMPANSIFAEKSVDGLTALARIANDNSLVGRTITELIAGLASDNRETQESNGSITSLGYNEILQSLDTLYRVCSIPSVWTELGRRPTRINLPLDGNDWQKFCAYFSDEEKHWITAVFESRNGSAGNISYVSTRIGAYQFGDDDGFSLDREFRIFGDSVLSEPLSVLETIQHFSVSNDKILGFLACLRCIDKYKWTSPEFQDLIQSLEEKGVFVHTIRLPGPIPLWCKPYCYFLFLWANRNAEPTIAEKQRNLPSFAGDESFASTFVDEVVFHTEFALFVQVVEAGFLSDEILHEGMRNRELLHGVFREFANETSPQERLKKFHPYVQDQVPFTTLKKEFSEWLQKNPTSSSKPEVVAATTTPKLT